MKISARYYTAIVVLFLTVMITSCSAPAYRQNKYKSGKRFRDCGCMTTPHNHNNAILSLNETK